MANLSKKFTKPFAVLMAASMLLSAPVYAETEAEEPLAEETTVAEAGETAEAEDTTEAEVTTEAPETTEAETATGSSINQSAMTTTGRQGAYATYLESHADAVYPDTEIVINAAGYISTETDDNDNPPAVRTATYMGEENCLYWANDAGQVTYEFEVKQSGLYNLEMFYYPIAGNNTTVEIGMKLDGEYPFSAAKTFTLDRYWADESAIRKDSRDNEIRPGQTEYDTWVTYPVKDKEGLFNEPYYFYLEAGKHTLTFIGIKVNVAFKSFTFKNYDAPDIYTRPSDEELNATPALTGTNVLGTNTLFYQAENNLYKTASTLYATTDRTSYMTNPSHPTKQRYNTIGLDTWDKATQAVTWEITIPADGYYTFDFRVRQNTMRGFYSNRRIYIDGVVPNNYFDDVLFPYDANWYCQGITDENGEPVYVYLTAGKHTFTMEAIPGSIGEVMQRLDDLVYEMNYYYRRILMITGPEPDEFNDYFVDTQIPELIPTFEKIIAQLYEEKANIEKLGTGSGASTLEATAVILQRCVDDPDDIPMMVSTIKDYISSLSAWMRDYRDQPLEMDYFEVRTVHEAANKGQSNFFEDLAFNFNAFIGSFFEDYTSLSDKSETSLKVWVSLARDQATVVKELVDSDFNVNHKGITAQIDLVVGGILEATMANKGPEIALFIGGDFPIQLAARDLLVDLTRFSDYEEIVSERFTENISTLYTYGDGVYGLPVNQNFPMMFYRTDIFEELGIEEPPETWDELIDMISIFQRSYLDVGLVSPASNLSSSVFDAGDTFVMLMLQSGQNIYTDDLSKTTYDTEASMQAFTTWTKFYTVYSLEQSYDAFSRFRTGEMPIIIQPYTFYNQLSVAAPEIKGLWDFTLVPGTLKEDGTVDHSVNSSTSGAIIFNKVSNTNAAWEFIKWFTEDEVQVEYARTIEALLGPMGRFDTANVNALAQLPWSSTEYEKIAEAMSYTVEVPIIPASYATTRHTKNAFRAVVNDSNNPRYALTSYNRDINSEIERKNEELAAFN